MIADIFHHVTEDFHKFLSDEGTTEIVVNRPNEIGVEVHGEWQWHAADLPFDKLEAIAILAAFHTGQDISQDTPICRTNMPNGERLHVVMPPVTDNGTISLTMRRPPSFQPTIAGLQQRGMFDQHEGAARAFTGFEMAGGLAEKLSDAVVARKNIIICGATGSGKTTLSRALIQHIPLHERLITIEDTREWKDIPHRNWVALKYSKTGAGVKCKDLVESGLRMRPDRVLIGELSDEAAFHWIRNAIGGHPGGITTLHASSAKGAFDALRLMCRESTAGQSIPDADIREMLQEKIDIIVHCKHEPKAKRHWIDDVYEKESVH
jgi:type IV secretion system protein VirB11